MRQFIDVNQFIVPAGTSKRFTCPNCGGDNTLSVSNVAGAYKYFCFRAMCNTKGTESRGLSLSDLTTSRQEQPKFATPENWTSPLTEISMRYLKTHHCWDAFKNRLIDIRIDPALARIVFIYNANGEQGAVGRYLATLSKQSTYRAVPKWYRYPGSTKYPLICGTGSEECVIVEDAASACAVSSVVDGLAILGTHLTDEALLSVFRYKSVVICLDPDAKDKALRFHKLLNVFRPTRLVFPPNDLKYFPPKEIREILKAGQVVSPPSVPSGISASSL